MKFTLWVCESGDPETTGLDGCGGCGLAVAHLKWESLLGTQGLLPRPHSLSITLWAPENWLSSILKNCIIVALPRDSRTMEFIKIFSSPLHKKTKKQTARTWNKCFFFKSWPVPRISDRSNRCSGLSTFLTLPPNHFMFSSTEFTVLLFYPQLA